MVIVRADAELAKHNRPHAWDMRKKRDGACAEPGRGIELALGKNQPPVDESGVGTARSVGLAFLDARETASRSRTRGPGIAGLKR